MSTYDMKEVNGVLRCSVGLTIWPYDKKSEEGLSISGDSWPMVRPGWCSTVQMSGEDVNIWGLSGC